MKEIELTQGKVALVDDEDYEWLSQWKWQYHKDRNREYACRRVSGESSTRIWMHREILNLNDDLDIVPDHIDHNGLNNTKYNLRISTKHKNIFNQRKKNRDDNTSEYKGVSFRNGDYIARIRKNNELFHLGTFSNEIACANCYNYHAKELFGEYALLNEIPFMSKEEWTKYKKEVKKTSSYKGVCYDQKNSKWISSIYLPSIKNNKFIGYYDSEKDAIIARNNRIIELGLDESKIQEVM